MARAGARTDPRRGLGALLEPGGRPRGRLSGPGGDAVRGRRSAPRSHASVADGPPDRLPMIADLCRWCASTIDVESGWRGGPTYRVSTVADGCAFGYRATPVGAIVVVIPAFARL